MSSWARKPLKQVRIRMLDEPPINNPETKTVSERTALLKKDNPLIGIGITTCNRREVFERCITEHRKYLPPRHVLYVNDDSETREGIAASKNKCIHRLKDCDYIVLFDDDIWPIQDKWWEPFLEVALNHGCHYLSPTFNYPLKGRSGTLLNRATLNGMCQFFTKECVNRCGGYNTMFGLWGGEHTEYSMRIFLNKLTPYDYCDFENSLNMFHSMDKEKSIASTTPEEVRTPDSLVKKIQHENIGNYVPFESDTYTLTFFDNRHSIHALHNWVRNQTSRSIVLHSTAIEKLHTPHVGYIQTHQPLWAAVETFFLENRRYIQGLRIVDFNVCMSPKKEEATLITAATHGGSLPRMPRFQWMLHGHSEKPALSSTCLYLPNTHVLSLCREIQHLLNHPLHTTESVDDVLNLVGYKYYDTVIRTVDTRPVLMILCCQKYRANLDAAMKRFQHPSWITIGVVGGQVLEFKDSIVTLPVSDTYDDHPKKVVEAFAWIRAQFPHSVGIFKTDDDIYVNDIETLAKTIQEHICEPYWGFVTSMCEASVIGQKERIDKFTDKETVKRHPKAHYCYGHGYWVTSNSVQFLMNHAKDYYEQSLEDVCTGSILNNYSIIPKRYMVAYKEEERASKI